MYDSQAGRLTCRFCAHAFDEGELKREIPLGDAAVEKGETTHVESVEGFLQRAPWQVGSAGYVNAVTYSCPACGANVNADQSTVATTCPYCGNSMLVQGTATGDNIPGWVVPFALTRDEAIEHMRRHFKNKLYLSRKFNAQVEHLQGVYVPYHLYDLHVSGWANYIGYHESTEGKGPEPLSHYLAMRRAGHADISMLPVDGSSKMPDAHMNSIAPFDFTKMREFSAEYLPGFLAEVADEDADECLPRVKKHVRSQFEEQLAVDAKHSPGVNALDVTSHKTDVDVVDVKTCLLPVWLMHCTWEGDDMLFAVNGDTGTCVGSLPIDKARRRATLAIGFIISTALALYLIMAFSAEHDMPGFMYVIPALVFALPLAFDGFFKRQMNMPNEAEGAGMECSTTGLVLTESWEATTPHLDRDKAVADLREHAK